MRGIGLALLLALTLALGVASSVSAQIHRTIEEIGPADLLKSERQRARADELALRHLGDEGLPIIEDRRELKLEHFGGGETLLTHAGELG